MSEIYNFKYCVNSRINIIYLPSPSLVKTFFKKLTHREIHVAARHGLTASGNGHAVYQKNFARFNCPIFTGSLIFCIPHPHRMPC